MARDITLPQSITLDSGTIVSLPADHPIVAQLNELVASRTVDIDVPLDQLPELKGRTIEVPSYTPANTKRGVVDYVHFDRHDGVWSIFFTDGTAEGIDADTDHPFITVLAD